jgi:hypothetical protein
MLLLRGRRFRIALAIAVVVVFSLTTEYVLRCWGKPLTREEAIERADRRLDVFSKRYIIGVPPPTLVAEQYETDTKAWIFTFQNSTCTVDIIADRCNGTDIGGVSAGCVPRRMESGAVNTESSVANVADGYMRRDKTCMTTS